jgi:hypothetical protein
MTAIRIEVEPEVAKAFQSANKIDRQKLQLLVNGWLKQSLQRRSLDEIIDQMQAEAKANGLTQAILDEVVRGDDEFTFRPNNY